VREIKREREKGWRSRERDEDGSVQRSSLTPRRLGSVWAQW
jgi:hypothetical protein